jgi:hypothetical protein
MTQAIIQPNEFILRVEEDAKEIKLVLRNPHCEIPNNCDYDIDAYIALMAIMQHFKALSRKKKMIVPLDIEIPDDDSDT